MYEPIPCSCVEIFHFCNAKSPISNTGSYLFKIYSNLNQIYSITETTWFIHGSYMVPTCPYMVLHVPIWFLHGSYMVHTFFKFTTISHCCDGSGESPLFHGLQPHIYGQQRARLTIACVDLGIFFDNQCSHGRSLV